MASPLNKVVLVLVLVISWRQVYPQTPALASRNGNVLSPHNLNLPPCEKGKEGEGRLRLRLRLRQNRAKALSDGFRRGGLQA